MSSPMYDLPDHFPIPCNADGEGPVPDDEADHIECWCVLGRACPTLSEKEISP